MTADLDTEIVTNALKRAGLVLCKTNGNGTLNPFEDLARAIRAEITLAYESERAKRLRGFEALSNACSQWTPGEISGIRARAAKDIEELTGCRDPRLAITTKDKGPRPYHAASQGERSETGNEYEVPKKPEPCPHASMDDDGGPPVEKDWDTSPKVGYGVDDHEGREAQRKSDAARIAAVMGWKD